MAHKSIKLGMLATVATTALLLGGITPIVRAQQTPIQTPAPAAVPATTPAVAPAATKQPKAPRYSSDWVDKRIKILHTKLHITTEQESVWNDVAVAMRDNAKSMQVLIDRWANQAAKMTALDSLRLHGEMAEENAKGQHKLIPAFEKLYNMMSAEQKKIADDVFARHEGRRHHRSKQK